MSTTAIPPARRKAPPANMPPGFEAPYTSFEPRFASRDELIMVMFGIEERGGEDAALRERLLACLNADGGPVILERARMADGFGPPTQVWFAYWSAPADYSAWRDSSGIEAVFDDAELLSSDTGLWRETCHISLDHNETSFSRDTNLSGLVNLDDTVMGTTDIHAYWGSARDRLVAAEDDSLDAEITVVEADLAPAPGRRVRLKGPENCCLIRTTQDLSDTNAEQRATYVDKVRPALHEGVRDLMGNPETHNCFGMRFVEERTDTNQPGDRTVGVGWFTSLEALEKWTHHSATHGEIMKQFMGMVEAYRGQPGLGLWHEVTVFPKGTVSGDYVNCVPDGKLRAAG